MGAFLPGAAFDGTHFPVFRFHVWKQISYLGLCWLSGNPEEKLSKLIRELLHSEEFLFLPKAACLGFLCRPGRGSWESVYRAGRDCG